MAKRIAGILLVAWILPRFGMTIIDPGRIGLSGRISAGDLLMSLSFIGSAWWFFRGLDKRLIANDEWRHSHQIESNERAKAMRHQWKEISDIKISQSSQEARLNANEQRLDRLEERRRGQTA